MNVLTEINDILSNELDAEIAVLSMEDDAYKYYAHYTNAYRRLLISTHSDISPADALRKLINKIEGRDEDRDK